MEYSVEELKSALIEKCESEGILYATVAMDRRTKDFTRSSETSGILRMYLQESKRPICSGGDY